MDAKDRVKTVSTKDLAKSILEKAKNIQSANKPQALGPKAENEIYSTKKTPSVSFINGPWKNKRTLFDILSLGKHTNVNQICLVCGKENKPGNHYCIQCGNKLYIKTEESSETKICPYCGASNENDAAFCIHCGIEL
ncbi:MAG: zinc ribbon domain-containing protein [Oscillospiraceae bacterium]|nr:zinc ribbon domain-containing protein [Oscillospiraceae bacterium]